MILVWGGGAKSFDQVGLKQPMFLQIWYILKYATFMLMLTILAQPVSTHVLAIS